MKKIIREQLSDCYQNDVFFQKEIQEIANSRLLILINDLKTDIDSEHTSFKLKEHLYSSVSKINLEFDSEHSYLSKEDDEFLAYLLITFPRSTDDLIWLLEKGFPLNRVFYYTAEGCDNFLSYNMLTLASTISNVAIELLLTLGAKTCNLDISNKLLQFLKNNTYPNLVARKRWEHLTEIYNTGNEEIIFSFRKKSLSNSLLQLKRAKRKNEDTIDGISIELFEKNLFLYWKRKSLDFILIEEENTSLEKIKYCKKENDLIQLIDLGFPVKLYKQKILENLEETNDRILYLINEINF